MFSSNTVLLLISTVSLYFYWFLKKSYKYFENHGIPYEKPHILFGNMKGIFLLRKNFNIEFTDIYRRMKSHQLVGVYKSFIPSIMICDPDLIKRVLIKDFSHFYDHVEEISTDVEPIIRNLFLLKGNEWKNLRTKMTGAFTSGKMKLIFPLVKKCAEEIEPALQKCLEDPNGVDIKDICNRYAVDVIASCAFGLEKCSLRDPNCEFRKMGKHAFEFRVKGLIRAIFLKMPSTLIKLFGLYCFDKETTDYFTSIIEKTIEYKEKNNTMRCDLLEHLITMKKNSKIPKVAENITNADLENLSESGDKSECNLVITNEILAAQCFLFYEAGCDTSGHLLAFMLLELAQAQEIQQKVRQEITTLIENNDGKFTYDILDQMKYTELVIQETLRKYPPGGVLWRICVQRYQVPESNIFIEKNIPIFIPVHALHTDERYYEKPDDFYPEHFTEEAKAKRPQCTYLPFGDGPRKCIGYRLGKITVKAGIAHFIRHFEFSVHPRTRLPVEFMPGTVFGEIKGGNWLICREI